MVYVLGLVRPCRAAVIDDGVVEWVEIKITLGLATFGHGLGMKVFSWTLNDRTIILDYLKNGNFDGFISDYPAYVVYDYYTMK